MRKIYIFMRKHPDLTLLITGMIIILFIVSLVSCSLVDDDSPRCSADALVLNITSSRWNDELSTRASYSAFSEGSGGNKTFSITYQSGDAIGLYAVDKTGKVVIANRQYRYSGSAWLADTPIEYVAGLGSYTFFAYYPWVPSLSGAPALNSTPDVTSAKTFFATAITAWTPAADQSTVENFTAQDLMVAKGTNSTPYFHEVSVAFTMEHQMGLLITKGILSYYDIDDPSDTWTVNQTFSPNVPYAISDKYYYFAKPGVPTTLGSKTITVESGQVEQLYFTNGEPSSR